MKRLPTFLLLVLSLSFVYGQKTKVICEDSVEKIRINRIYISGNKITRPKIIHRELVLKQGDTLCYNAILTAIKKSKDNLNNTSLFNFVDITDSIYYTGAQKQLDVKIKLAERWYIWPIPLLELAERNPNVWWETKDLSKLNYGLNFKWGNFRGRREVLKLIANGGYNEIFGFHYDIPSINKAQTIGLVLGAGIKRNHEITYQTIDNKPIRYRAPVYIRHEYYAYSAINIRKNIHTSHYLQLEYKDHQYSNVVFLLNPEFDPKHTQKFNYFSLIYYYKNDHRDNRNFPLTGYYLDAILIKRGLGITPNSQVNLLSLTSNYKKYWDLGNHFYFASGLSARMANTGRNPYFLNIGLGYNRDFVRGYEHYVIDGENFALLKTDLKYALFKDQITKLPFLPDKFSKIPWSIYLNFFIDAAYSTTELPQLTNTLQNEALLGYGAGINLISYYDIVIRFEYSFNKMGERGIFFSLQSSI